MRKLLHKWLKIPAEPDPPAGSHESVQVFRAAKNFYYLLLAKWVLKQVSLLIGILFSLYMLYQWSKELHENLVLVIKVFEGIGIAGYLFQIPLSLALVKLDYELRWYIVTDRSLRIRAGIWDIREMTMTCANIQQASVNQGPLQRMLGISDLLVRTAGGGSGGEVQNQHQKGAAELMHVAYFHGVDNAEEIKELIQERMKQFNDAGLGDPDEFVESSASESEGYTTPEVLVAAREFSAQARELRKGFLSPYSGH